jgi:CRISPR/Cas system-associated exonuclease Cas4 (RecB family)
MTNTRAKNLYNPKSSFTFKLSPSDFAFLYEECKFCYCLKVKENISQPSMPMPGVFSAINARLQGTLVGKNLRALSSDLPDVEVISQEKWVESMIVPETNVFIKGKYDLLAKNSDDSYTLVDLKISQPAEDKIEKYKTQLGAYKFALENPANGETVKITRMGLLVFYPDTVTFENEVAQLDFPPKWLEIPCDDANFIGFAKGIDKLLSDPSLPEDQGCKWCAYRRLCEKIIQDKNDLLLYEEHLF